MEPSHQPTPPVVVKEEPITEKEHSPSPIIDQKPKLC
ncbi:hypothetical protein A2U01_0109716, partial [Trifolium medium]|nr:hypothetical protein [Trifolium medium]